MKKLKSNSLVSLALMLLFIVDCSMVYSQNKIKAAVGNIKVSPKSNNLFLNFEIQNYKPRNIYNVETSFRFSPNSRLRQGESLKSIKGGNQFISLKLDKEDEKYKGNVRVYIKLYQFPKIPVAKHLIKSVIFPGFGDYRLRNGWAYFSYGLVGYGSLATAYYCNTQANSFYSKYLVSDDISNRKGFYSNANDYKMYTYISIATAATVWALDLIFIAIKSHRLKKNLNEKKSRYYYKQFMTPKEYISPYEFVDLSGK